MNKNIIDARAIKEFVKDYIYRSVEVGRLLPTVEYDCKNIGKLICESILTYHRRTYGKIRDLTYCWTIEQDEWREINKIIGMNNLDELNKVFDRFYQFSSRFRPIREKKLILKLEIPEGGSLPPDFFNEIEKIQSEHLLILIL